MVVKIRFPRGPQVTRKTGKNRHVAFTASELLRPLALMAYVLSVWRLSSDIGLTGEFALRGAYAHWQIWAGLGAIAQITAFVLHRYGTGGELHWPHIFLLRINQQRPGPDATDAQIETTAKARPATAGK